MYLVVLPQPQREDLPQTVTGGVGVVRDDGFQVALVNPQGDTEVQPPPREVCHS